MYMVHTGCDVMVYSGRLAIKVTDLLHFLSFGFHTFLSRPLSYHCQVLIDHEPKSN